MDYIKTTLQKRGSKEWAVWDPVADFCEDNSKSSGSIKHEKFIKDPRN
jgi:hypothetical protein